MATTATGSSLAPASVRRVKSYFGEDVVPGPYSTKFDRECDTVLGHYLRDWVREDSITWGGGVDAVVRSGARCSTVSGGGVVPGWIRTGSDSGPLSISVYPERYAILEGECDGRSLFVKRPGWGWRYRDRDAVLECDGVPSLRSRMVHPRKFEMLCIRSGRVLMVKTWRGLRLREGITPSEISQVLLFAYCGAPIVTSRWVPRLPVEVW